MPNKSSKAGFIPLRTCVVCRKKDSKKNLLRFVLFKKDMIEVIFDINAMLPDRGYYVCNKNSCLEGLNKWMKKQKKRWKKKI